MAITTAAPSTDLNLWFADHDGWRAVNRLADCGGASLPGIAQGRALVVCVGTNPAGGAPVGRQLLIEADSTHPPLLSPVPAIGAAGPSPIVRVLPNGGLFVVGTSGSGTPTRAVIPRRAARPGERWRSRLSRGACGTASI
ncbi:MAG TPA: hypothetical protein PKE32_07755 [Miltoncostaeaceae bacterium]|nr:hypothetical protein [Miltoncostaeaceae bacterium]